MISSIGSSSESGRTLHKRGKMEGEVRRIHIIYFLSIMGRLEHPHLIRLHYLNRNGVHLRDVKRWMADLRGKDMVEAFAWSYKRRYKNGYVWQDLVDDDLITPICDNEFVLKGSKILPVPGPVPSDKEQEKSWKNEGNHTSPDSSVETSSEIYQESPTFSSERSTLTEEDSMKQEKINSEEEEEETEKLESFSSVSSNNYCILMSRKNANEKDDKNTSSSEFSMSYPSPKSQFGKRKNYSSGASKMLRNIITCGAVDTNDSALVSVHKSSINTKVSGTHWNQQYHHRKSFDGVEGSKQQQQQKTRFGNPNCVAAANKPVGAPTCSQCGKSFKPEKLYTHMKSCKGLKVSARSATASVKKRSPSSNEIVAIPVISK